MTPTIRTAREHDTPQLVELQRRASMVWDDYRAHLERNPDAVELPAEQVRSGGVRVAVDGHDRLVGFSAVICVADDAVELDGLFVDPEHMRRGIGSLLLEDVAERARGAGVKRIDVTANPGAVAFYDRHGFRKTGTSQTLFGSAPRMTLEL